MKPPTTPAPVKAPSTIEAKAGPTCSIFATITISAMPTYNAAIHGTTRSVTDAIEGIPPTITENTNEASTIPVITPYSLGTSKAYVNIACAWFAWNMLPAPNVAKIHINAKPTANILPKPPRPFSLNPWLK